MNKKLKKIVAITLAVSAFSAITPATKLNLINTKAYAATGDLTSIKVKTSDGSAIKTYSEDDYKSKNQVDDDEIDDGQTYYAKTSTDQIKISTSGVTSSHVRIFKGRNSSTKGIKTSSTIELTEGSASTLTVRTYDEDPGSVRYDDDSYVSEYVIRVECTGTESDSTDSTEEENGDVYLKSLYLSDGEFDFSKSTSTYNVNVDESLDEVRITAKPDCDSDEYDDYEVTIDDSVVDESDKFRKTVSLNEGKNEIKVTVEDDNDEKRTYILNITRGKTTQAATTENTSNTSNNNNINTSGNNELTATVVAKTNQWIEVNGRWQYNDSMGNAMKNAWVQNYYLQADGNMATGWQYINGYWYHFGNDGNKKAGWQSVGGNWYYLDSEGRMQTGWIKDITGKYYYLNSNGSMAYNTTINGYKLGANGAWIR